jgi:hypothetical protein
MNMKQRGPQSWSARFRENYLAPARIPTLDTPVHSLATIPATLSLWQHDNLGSWYPPPRLDGVTTQKNVNTGSVMKILYENNECMNQHMLMEWDDTMTKKQNVYKETVPL